MAVPTPPTAGEPIAEAWGDLVHDAVVAMDLQTGTDIVTFTGSSVVSDAKVVTFPRPFASPPVVVCMMGPHSDTRHFLTIRTLAGSPCATVQVQARNSDNANSAAGPVPFQWLAYGPRA